MPHVIVKLYPGRSEEQKIKLAGEIVKDVVAIAKCDEKSVSVAFEEVAKEDWAEKVYGGGPQCLDGLMGGISSEPVVDFFVKHQAASANG
jgi:4-oxalocrotonate tautomerase